MRSIILSLVALAMTGCASFHKNPAAVTPPPPPREFRAVWVATVANIDWPSKPGLPVEKQLAEMRAILDKAVELNLNAVILQVRTSCDAFYSSDYEPWSEYLTGRQGQPPAPYYDPLATWVRAAHQRGLELHAWFNPYRARRNKAKSPDAPDHIANTRPDLVKKFHDWEWLDPGEPDAREHTLRVIADVVRRYDVDGVHIDDYFYPYPDYLTDPKTKQVSDFPDDPAWQRYQKSGGTLSRADWRRDNVNQMIHDIYTTVKNTKQHVKFGISPFGIWRPDNPEGVKGFDQYEKLYADAKLWLNEGWCDYFTPQIYWRIDAPDHGYLTLLRWWISQNTQHRHIWAGNDLEWVDSKESAKAWPASEIVDQIDATRNEPGASGNVFFSMIALMQNRGGLNDLLKEGPYRDASLVPPSPWLGETQPIPPMIGAERLPGGSLQVSWDNGDVIDPWQWGLAVKAGDQWRFNTFPGQVRNVIVSPPEGVAITYITVTAVDRLGNASAPRSIDLLPPKCGCGQKK
jgi:uncharacterized lipoprotein YddW (UPF0748 family)